MSEADHAKRSIRLTNVENKPVEDRRRPAPVSDRTRQKRADLIES